MADIMQMIESALKCVDITPKETSHEDFMMFLHKQQEKNGDRMNDRTAINHMFVNL